MSTAGSSLAGVGSGSSSSTFNAAQYVAQIIASEQGPETLMQQQVSVLSAQASALSDLSTQLTTLQNAVYSLTDFQGALAAKTTTSSDSSVVSATADSTATSGSHTLTVANLATTSSEYSSTLADGNTTFGTGSFTVQVGTGTAATVTVDSTNNTLSGLADAINAQNIGVTASVITDASGARLSLVSDTSGAPGDLTIASNTTGISFTKAITGTNANFTLDGVSLSSASNSVTGALSGVTLDLTGTTSSPVTVTVSPDTTQATTAIQSFVSAYNDLIGGLNAQFTYNTTTKTTGPLGSDSTAMQLQQSMLGDAAFAISGNSGYTNLASIGISMNEDGTLAVDTSTLNAAMTANFSAVQNLFQQSSPVGFAQNFSNDLSTWTDPSSGPIAIDQQGISQTTASLNQEISDFQARLDSQQQVLMQTYSHVSVVLQQMPLLINQVQQQVASLP